MAKKSEIIKSLQKLTKIESQGDDESRQEFLERLATGSSEFFEDKDDVWEGLPKPTQSWVNAAVKALNAEKDIADPDEVKEPEVDQPEETEDAEETGEEDADDHEDDGDENEEDSDVETKSKKRTAKKKAPAKKVAKKNVGKKTVAAKPAKKAASRGNGAVRGTGAQTLIKQMMLKDPNISTEDLISRLEKKGLKPTKVAVTSIRSGMRHTLKVMADAGVLHSSIKMSKEA